MDEFLAMLSEELGKSIPAGDNTRFCCPICGESKFKFYVRNSTGVYQCFHCGATGNPIKFLESYFGYNYSQAKEQVEDWSGEELDAETTNRFSGLTDMESLYLAIVKGKDNLDKEEKAAKTVIPLPTNLKLLKDNMNNPEAYPFLGYLHNRGVTLEEINTHLISYVVEGEVRKSNKDEGGNFEYFKIRNSIVFLTFDDDGNYLYWNSRSIEPNPVVKSLNGPATLEEHSKNDVIFNLNRAKLTGAIVIFEGVFNALMAGQSGVATFGKMVTDDQLDRLRAVALENPNTNFVVFLDSDARKQASKLAERIHAFTDKVFIVDSPYGDRDANDLGREITAELIRKAKPYTPSNDLALLINGLQL